MPTSVYLLFNGERVLWSFEQEPLQTLLSGDGDDRSSDPVTPADHFLIPEVMMTAIDADLAEALAGLPPITRTINHFVSRSEIPTRYFEERREFLQRARREQAGGKAGWEWATDLRVFIIFERDGT